MDFTQRSTPHAAKKLKQNRPLAHIEDHYRYVPPQPVLSCRTVEVDISGTRTYRAKSAAEIIEEQQRLIHHVYKQARNAVSAPARKNQINYQQTTNMNHPLKSLSIHGNQPLTPRKPRPATGVKKQTTIILKPRPNTALGTSTTTKSTQSRIAPQLFEDDPEWRETSTAYQNTNKKLREQWSAEKHSLDEGQFVRGKRDNQLSSLDTRSGNQWLMFGGGQDSTSSGIVDAFTVMKPQGEVYSIDGTTGSQVARKLRKGDKIRVGVNGNVHSYSMKIKQWATEQEKKLKESEERQAGRPGCPVPLCWDDQLKQESIKIVSPCTGGDTSKLKSLFETHPVIVNNTPRPSQTYTIPQKAVKINEGYKVKVRSKVHSASATDQVPRVTASISIDKRSDEFEREIENLTYEDILRMKVKHCHVGKPDQRPEVKDHAEQKVTDERFGREHHTNTQITQSHSTVTSQPPTGKPIDMVSEMNEANARMNGPPTSHGSVPNGLEIQELIVGAVPTVTAGSRSSRAVGSAQLTDSNRQSRSGRPSGSARPDSRSVSRVSSAGRPPPVKPSQWRNAPSSVAGGTKDPEYIQIAQKVPVPRPQSQQLSELSMSSVIPGASLKDAIDSVTSCNRPLYSPGGSIPDHDDLSLPDDVVALVASEDENNSTLATPPPSPSPVPEYAFDIPTAGALESEANSVVTPGDLEKDINPSVKSSGS